MWENEARRRWEANAGAWAKGVESGSDRYRALFHDPALIGLLGDVSGCRVVDVGCGEGRLARQLAAAGADVTGVDFSANLIASARSSGPTGARFTVGSYLNLADCDLGAPFDVALSTMALMDSPDIERALSQIGYVVRAGGRLLYSVAHPATDRTGSEWDDSGPSARLTVGDYFRTEPWVDRWSFGGVAEGSSPDFEIVTFPRTISAYINATIQAGFRVAHVAEPVPSDEACAAYPRLRRWTSMPFYLMVLAVREP